MPHIRSPHKRAALVQEFPVCQPVREDTDDKEPMVANHSAATEPLWVVLARVDDSTAQGSTPVIPARKRPRPASTNSWTSTTTSHITSRSPHLTPRPINPSTLLCTSFSRSCPHKDEVRRLRRWLRRYEENLYSLLRRVFCLEDKTEGCRHN